MDSQEKRQRNGSILVGYEEATAWLEHASALTDCSQGKDRDTIISDCSHALQCIEGINRSEGSQAHSHSLKVLAQMLREQMGLLEAYEDALGPSPDGGGGEEDGSRDSSAKSRRAAVTDTLMQKSSLTFHDVAGLVEAKQLLREAIIMPLQYSHLFTGPRKPWKSILLYGPPGTGKTRLGQALSGEIGSNFYCVSSSDFLSSWVGESEKIIKELFQHARRSSGISVIFIDEVDCICRQRSSREEEHSRRIKTELLRQMEGADCGPEQDGSLFLLSSTNCPWELDSAFIRRFQKRIYVPLPGREVRLTLLKMHFASVPSSLGEVELGLLASRMEGYSGSDIAVFCSDASMMPIRELQNATHWKLATGGHGYRACSPTDPNGRKMRFEDIPPNQVCTRHITLEDCLKSLQHNHATITAKDIKRFEDFTQQFGQIG